MPRKSRLLFCGSDIDNQPTLRAFKDHIFAAVAIYLWQEVIFRMAVALGGGQGTHPCTSW
jgi:hypothetical protein